MKSRKLLKSNLIHSIVCLVIAITGTGQATVLHSVRVASGLNLPVFVASLPGDPEALVVIEQHAGLIRIVRNGVLLARPFLNIHDRVISTGTERGLLGLAFHPNYAANGYFYVDYDDLVGNTVISRFQVTSDPDSANPASELIMLNIVQPFENHNGGMLAFGPNDGYLYIGMGDGGSSGDPLNNAQNDSTLLGKLLRIDVDNGRPYGIPPSNPFVGVPGKRAEIWDKGVRNPWRFSFDRANGNLFIGDVGQNLWEEIDFEPANSPGGINYGWRLMEGLHCYNPPNGCDTTGITLPFYEYGHAIGCAITGGYVYCGGEMPNLDGTYFFADFCANKIWSFRYDGANMSEFTDRTNELDPSPGQPINSISSFGENENGDIYVVDLSDGEVFEIVPANPGAIRGTVTGNLGLPVSGAIATIMHSGLADITDVNGQYTLGGLGDGSFDLEVSQSGFRDTIIAGVVLGVGDTVVENISYLTGLVNNQLPLSFKLYQNYPNPFNAKTNIEYNLDQTYKVSIVIFDIRGNKMATLVDSIQPPGHHLVSWDTNNATSGIYFYKIAAGTSSAIKKMVVLK